MPAYCNLHFNGEGDAEAEAVAARVYNFWFALRSSQMPFVTANVSGLVEEINPENGAILALHDAVTNAVVGTATEEPLPPANQLLIRLRTSTLGNNRLVQGRFNVPGRSEGASEGGVVPASVTAPVSAAALTLAAPGTATGMVVWRRPVNEAGGSIANVTAVSCWEQFAILTSRRD